jgi:SsrA-binding protein
VAKTEGGYKLLADNRKARFNYSIDDTLETGIVLVGTEVKSVKSAQFSFADAYARVMNDELWLIGFQITPYAKGSIFNHDPVRNRKLLVHAREIKWLERKSEEKGFTLVPLKVILKNGRVKIEIGLGKGKKLYDKRETIKNRQNDREVRREFKLK